MFFFFFLKLFREVPCEVVALLYLDLICPLKIAKILEDITLICESFWEILLSLDLRFAF